MLFGKFGNPTIALTALALLSTGCPGGDEPVINSFTASPTTVQEGSTTTLSWDVTGADSIKISATPGGEVITTAEGKGSRASGAITDNTMFVLEATNDEGTVSRTISVLVQKQDNPTIDSFTATPDMVESGGQVVLAWETTNATSVDITPNVLTGGDPDGQTTVNVAQTSSFTLTARNATGTATAMVVVTVVGPQIQSFTATPQSVTLGEETTLAWTVLDAVTVTITNDAGDTIYEGTDLTGSTTDVPMVAAPPGTVTYTLLAVDANNRSVAFMVTVNVNPVGGPTAMLTANPSSINLGETSSLDWVVTNAVGIEILEGATTLTTSTELTGSFEVTPAQTTTYTLVARDANDVTAMAMATVTVQAGPPVISLFDAAPNPVALGSPTTLSWNTLAADNIRILNGTTELLVTNAATGTVAVTPTATSTVYTIEATNTLGTNSSNVTVFAHPAPAIFDFLVTPLTFTGNSAMVTVTWDVSNVATLNLLADGLPVTGFPAVNVNPMVTNDQGTFTFTVNATTQLTLIAQSAGGTDMREATVMAVVGELEPNDTAGTANPLPGDGSGSAGMIGVVGDEDWYVVTVPAGGNLVAETSDGQGGCSLDTHLRVYSSTNAAPIADNDDVGGGNVCSLVTPFPGAAVAPDADLGNMAGGTYYIRVVEFGSDATGPYVLTVTVGSAGCGNRLIEGTEECDDGNTLPGDGCDAACVMELPTLPTQVPIVLSGSIGVVAEHDFYEFVVTSTVYVRAETFAPTQGTCTGADTLLAINDSNMVELGRNDDGGLNACSLITPADAFALLAPGMYTFEVWDFGDNGTIAAYELVVTSVGYLVCGNGITETGERCDDGNTVAGDGCDATCNFEVNPIVINPPGGTAMIPLNAPGSFQLVQVNIAIAGQSITATAADVGGTTCDTVDTGMVLANDQFVAIGERNVGGPIGTAGTCASFYFPQTVFARNLAAGTYYLAVYHDGAAGGGTVQLDVGIIDPRCGDRVVNPNEACDDGNTADGDGCSAACALEGTFIPEIEANNTPQTATSLGALVTGITDVNAGITPVGDIDFYTFTLAAPANALIGTYGSPGAFNTSCPGDTQLWLYNNVPTNFTATTVTNEPALVEYDDDSGFGVCSIINGTNTTPVRVTLPAGTYYLQVREFGSNAQINPYYLRIDLQ